jgi:hypothetical protein
VLPSTLFSRDPNNSRPLNTKGPFIVPARRIVGMRFRVHHQLVAGRTRVRRAWDARSRFLLPFVRAYKESIDVRDVYAIAYS